MRPIAWTAVLSLAATMTSAQDKPGATTTEARLSGSALIDRWIEAKWADQKLTPAGRCSDAEFIRRATLDIIGSIPSRESVEDFLKETGSGKRGELVERLLSSRQYATNWAEIWSGTLVGYEADNKMEVARLAVDKQLHATFAKNLPFDAFVRDVITATGRVGEGMMDRMMGKEEPEETADAAADNGLVAFYTRYQKSVGNKELPEAMAGKFSRTFLGTQIQCAQCHDHPFDKWTQEDFYGMAAFFTQLTVRRDMKNRDEKDGKKQKYEFVVEDRPGRGKMKDRMAPLTIPGTKTAVKATFLDTKEAPKGEATLREEFARMITSKENVQFARATVNRYWGHFFGRGIVNPVDEFNDRNKPSHPELLDALAKDFADHGCDVKQLIRAITGSRAYQLTSSSRERSGEMEKYASISAVRALTPEQIFNSLIMTIATSQEDVDDIRQDKLVRGALRNLRYAFGDDEGAETVAFEGTIPGALTMMNSEIITRAASVVPGGKRRITTRLMKIMQEEKTPADKIRAIYLSVLSRPPKDAELARMLEHARGGGKDGKGYEDVMWTLLNSSEFLFNH